MSNSELDQRLSQIEGRLDRIEREFKLDVSTLAPPTAPANSNMSLLKHDLTDPTINHPTVEPRETLIESKHAAQRTAAFVRWRDRDPTEPPNTPPENAAAQLLAEPAIEDKRPPEMEHAKYAWTPPTKNAIGGDFNLELQIGTRWVAWIGAILLVLAAGFFAKLAYDNNWIHISPAGRCMLLAAFGGASLVCGELCLRRISRASAVGLYGAGLGVLYLTALASYRYFNLVGGSTAFWFLVSVGALGFALTVRAQMLTIGVLSLIGGYLAPVLLRDVSAGPLSLPLYISVLFAVSLGLSAWREAPFRPIRGVVMGLHALPATFWLFSLSGDMLATAIVFVTCWWALLAAECMLAARREQSAAFNASAAFVMTLWMALVGCRLLAVHDADRWMGSFSFLLAGLAGALATGVARGLDGLREPARNARTRLAASFWLQAGVLLAAAVGMQFDEAGYGGVGRTIGWLAIGLACVELSRSTPSRGVELFGAIVGGLGLLRLVLVDCASSEVTRALGGFSLGSIGAFEISAATLLIGYAILTLLLAAWRLHEIDRLHSTIRMVLIAVAGIAWLGMAVLSGHGNLVTMLWMLPSVFCLHFARRLPRLHLFHGGALLIGLSLLRWLTFDALGPRLSPRWQADATWPLLNGQMLTAFMLVGCMWHAARAAARNCGNEAARSLGDYSAAIAGMSVFALIAMSFELERAVAMFGNHSVWPALLHVTLWLLPLWAAVGAWMAHWARLRNMPRLAVAGGVLTLLCCAAWMLFGALLPRFHGGAVATLPVLNLQCLVGCGLAAAAMFATRGIRNDGNAHEIVRDIPALSVGLAILIGLIAGSLEIDRYVIWCGANFESPAVVRLMGLSIYWGLFSLALIGFGFSRGRPMFRHFGLGLLGLTLAKVMLIDLASAQTIYRVLSLLALGLVLIVTSIAYSRLAKRFASAQA